MGKFWCVEKNCRFDHKSTLRQENRTKESRRKKNYLQNRFQGILFETK